MKAAPETISWLKRYYSLLDSGQVREAVEEFLSPDCTIRFANREPVDFMTEARRMATLVRGVRHELVSVLDGSEDGTLAYELNVTYLKHDGTEVTLPGALFARVQDGRFVEQRAYVDPAPLLT